MPKISRSFAKTQIERVMNRLFSPTKAELTDLVDALMTAAEGEQHAKEIIDAFVFDGAAEAGPTAGDIRRVGHATRRSETRPDPSCPKCSDGWIITERIVRGELVSGAAKCDCWTPAPKADAPVDRRMAAAGEIA